MRHITIDCRQITRRDALHAAFARELGFPDWYGGNLDALFDCLTELDEPTTLRLQGWETLTGALGGYADAILQVLADAAAENPEFSFEISNPQGGNSYGT